MSLSRRDLLHKTHLPEFIEWMLQRGWTLQPPKTEYEAARFYRARPKMTLIIHTRSSNHDGSGDGVSDHLTVPVQGVRYVHRFLKDRKNDA